MTNELSKPNQFLLKQFREHRTYENFFACRSVGMDTMELLNELPKGKRDSFFKTAYGLGIEDLDYSQIDEGMHISDLATN